jgi:hypothetical protein
MLGIPARRCPGDLGARLAGRGDVWIVSSAIGGELGMAVGFGTVWIDDGSESLLVPVQAQNVVC